MHDVRLHAVDQGADNGDTAHAARLEVEARVGAAGSLFQLVPIFAEEFLIGGDDRLAAVQRREDKALGGLDAADDLDDDIHVGIADHLGDVIGNFALLDAEIERALAVELQDALHRDVDVLRATVKFSVLGEDLIGSSADHAEAEYCNADTFHFLPSVLFRSYRYLRPCSVRSLST